MLRKLRLALASLLLVSAAAGAQDPEVWIFMNLSGERLADAAAKVASSAQIRVKVDPEIADRKVTLSLEHPLEEALEKIAAAARAHLWRVGKGSYRIRPTPQDGAAADEAPAEKEPTPEWKTKLLARLKKAEIDVEFEGTPLRKVLDLIAKKAGVRIHVDPEVARRDAADLEVHVLIVPARNSCDLALDAVAGAVKLHHDLRWGGVFVSTSARLGDLPESCLPGGGDAPEGEKAVRAKLAEKRVSVTLKESTVQKALDRIARLGGVEIGYAAKELRELPRVTISVLDLALEDVLSLILVPRGLRLTFLGGALKVKPR